MSTRVPQSQIILRFLLMKFITDFYNSIAVNAKCVIIEGDLVNAIFIVDKLHFINHIFGASHAVASSEHAYCAAEVTPKNAAPTGD